MPKILLVENDEHDAKRIQALVANEEFEIVRCDSGAQAGEFISAGSQEDVAAAIISWEIPGPPFGFSLLVKCRQAWPTMPVIIVSEMLDARLATRAYALGATDFLEKPFEPERVKSCLRTLLSKHDSFSPLVDQLQQIIVGKSPALISALTQVSKLIPYPGSRALFIGESGTGKELFAQAIHHLSADKEAPWVAVNVGEIPPTLIESMLFGHEKGAFTGATARHVGFFEEAKNGTLFLDEIGELELSLQVKLLRVIQEKEFRRIGGNSVKFQARLVCATNRDLAQDVRQGKFRQDLFHRIAEKTIQIPPLRERTGDVDILLAHFLDKYRAEKPVRFARETLTILQSYPFPGNVRELQNLVRGALIDCNGETILPHNLPLPNMATFLSLDSEPKPVTEIFKQPNNDDDLAYQELFNAVKKSVPTNWFQIPYHAVAKAWEQAFDRIYLGYHYNRRQGNITRAAASAKVDAKTFRKRLKECGWPLSGTHEEEPDE